MMIQLRPLKPTDHFSLFSIYSNKKVTRPAGFLPYAFQKQINDQMDEFLKTHTAITKDNQLVGVITCDILSETSVSVGIMIHQNYWNQGIGKEALTLYLKQLSKQHIRTVYADCLSKNMASIRLLESCGFVYKQDFKRKFPDFIDEKSCRLYMKELPLS